MDTHDTPEKSYDLERLIFFTDGVFAIVITLLVIELHVPEGWDRTLAGLFAAEWRKLIAYAISFFAVGMFWNAHRLMFRRIVRFHSGLVAFNFILLAFVVLLPFAVTLIFESGPRGEPFFIYIALIALIALSQALLWGFAAFVAKVVDPRYDNRMKRVIFVTQLMMPVLLSGIALAAANQAPPLTWVWILPVLVLLGRYRRRVLGTLDPRPVLAQPSSSSSS
ncbi:TMEM175 family protein [Sphingomonas humi]|uniref:DUF1211 domain-containing protein n=1 Tax=Sphingomonas humi TaxID=335630 RepID=A0ABP7RPM3_9SPHN